MPGAFAAADADADAGAPVDCAPRISRYPRPTRRPSCSLGAVPEPARVLETVQGGAYLQPLRPRQQVKKKIE